MFVAACLSLGCSRFDPPPPPPQIVIIKVSSDPGVPLGDASLLFNGKEVAKTGADGKGQLRLSGDDGDTFQVMVKCPEGYASPTRPVNVQLRRLAEKGKYPEYEVSCPPDHRTVVVAIRADNGAQLPVVHLGREVARTDASGAAHVLLKLAPGESFELMLDTSSYEKLKPQNPVANFLVSESDDVVLFDQKFDIPKKKRGTWRPKKAEPTGPVKIN